MKAKKFSSRLLAMLLMVMMILSLLSTGAFAEGEGGAAAQSDTDGPIQLKKTATLEDDGTYTIDLEAYATGELKITEEKVPLDIVLVLDQSGSMADPFTVITEENVTWEQITKDTSYNDTYSNEVYHKHSDGTYHLLNVTREWATYKWEIRYICPDCGFNHGIGKALWELWTDSPAETKLFSNEWKNEWAKEIYLRKVTTGTQEITKNDALKNTLKNFVGSVREDATTNSLEHKIAVVGFASQNGYGNNTEILSVEGDNTQISGSKTIGVAYNSLTATQYKNALVANNNSIIDQSIDALATYGATRADLGMEMARNILAANKVEGRKQVVIMFTDGSPTSSNGFETSVANKAISESNTIKKTGADVYTVGIFEGADGSVAVDNSTSDENRFMHAVSSNYPDADSMSNLGVLAKLSYYQSADNAEALNEVFDAISESITGSTSVTLGSEAVLKDVIADEFTVPDGASVSVKTADYLGDGKWAEAVDSGLTAKIDKATNTVSVAGFSYKDNYVAEGVSGAAATGKKLIVTITGIEAGASAATNEEIATNKNTSGIYENENQVTPVVTFPVPTTKITQKSYVLDYANPVTLSPADWEQSSVTSLDDDGMHKFTGTTVNLDMTYGMVEAGNNGLTYTPQTTKWDGYDSFYAFGKTAENKNMWSKVNVIPANNVYYEDDFITNEKNGTVGIEYSGDWTTVGTKAENTNTSVSESGNNAVHGWESSYADDSQFSEGSAQGADKGAKATFEFTGTGVDIYSKTDMTSGVVRAKLSKKNAEGTLVGVKGLVVNDLSASGEYYQIPTLFFSDLDYGTYTVEITVMTQTETEGGYTYYLDGIRVYNPLDPLGTDEVVDEAYGADETGALFTCVRNVLLEAGTVSADETANGAVFIDKNADGSPETTSSIATYKDYGPKNEVYIPAGKAIVFNVTDIAAENLYVGLKSPNGSTTAKVTNGDAASEIAIATAADMYYRITPNTDGYVLIENQGAGLLAVTKLRTAGMGAEEEISLFNSVSTMSLLSYADEFDSLAVVEYNTENDVIEVPETPVEPDEPSDVEIENPEPEQPKDDVLNSIVKLLEKIFGGFRGWFK